MTAVKNQTDCNAYYAFSTVAYLEQDLILNEGASSGIDLSEQFLASCLPSGGCNGGSPLDAMNLILKLGGIPTEATYPFSPWTNQPAGQCTPNISKLVKVGTRPLIQFYNINDQKFL